MLVIGKFANPLGNTTATEFTFGIVYLDTDLCLHESRVPHTHLIERARLSFWARSAQNVINQVNSTGFDADDSIPLQRRLEEVSLATLSEAPHK